MSEVISATSRIEDLVLSVRARNALHGVGCRTVDDVLRLDLSAPVRGVGRKTRDELIEKLQRAGFQHPSALDEPSPEIRMVERSLERIQGRVEAVTKEIRVLRQRLRKT